jgi:hypothetical protein
MTSKFNKVLYLGMFLAAGCGTSQRVSTGSAIAPASPPAVVDAVSKTSVLFDGDLSVFEPYGDEVERLLVEVREALTERCMSDRGFAYPRLPHVSPTRGGGINGMTRPDPNEAERSGFGRGSRAPIDSALLEAQKAQESLAQSTPGWFDSIAAEGAGCRDQAWSTIGRRLPLKARELFSRIASEVGDEYSRLEAADKAVAEAKGRWDVCARSAGVDPADIARLVTLPGDGSISVEVGHAARVSAECALSSGLYDANEALSRSIARGWVSGHEADIADLLRVTRQESDIIKLMASEIAT